MNQLARLKENTAALGAKRLSLLGLVAILVVGAVLAGSVLVNKPTYQPIYVGLERDDVGQMGLVLTDAGIDYDVNTEGTSLLVPAGLTSRARMVLAEKGLPNGSSTGYELFDSLGSLGLTAFMQEITRVRALEGEIARSIQTIQGVKAARVHIVMGQSGNFRRAEQTPTASVIVRYLGAQPETTATSIRHLVSAAVPSLSSEKVTVLDASGRLLAVGGDPLGQTAGTNLGIKVNVESQVVASVERALLPYLGEENFRVSVQADVSTDQRQIEETIFDPDSRVERSVQVVRSEAQSSQSAGQAPVTVEQNLVEPAAESAGGAAPSESERNERREETTNYELNTKRIATVSAGYTVDRLSVAVVVNRAALAAKNPDADPTQIDAQLDAIREVVTAAAGTSAERSDVVELTAVEFLPTEELLTEDTGSIVTTLAEQSGTAINALAYVIAIAMLVMMGIRPLVRAIVNVPALPAQPAPSPEAEENTTAAAVSQDSDPLPLPKSDRADQVELLEKMRPEPSERLSMIVDLDESRAAAILRKWVSQEAT